jgi:hypothetical protein
VTGILKPYKPKPRYIPKVAKHEQSEQRRVCTWLRYNLPNVLFKSDYGAGLKLSISQAMIQKSMQSGAGWPDLFIAAPRIVKGRQYAGMFIEMKKAGTAIYVTRGPRKGELVASEHIRMQADMLTRLNEEGYFACFGIGADDAIKKIQWYFGMPVNLEMF